jgi:hypothetical protein
MLKKNDIIEVVMHDEAGKKKIRRVRVKTLAETSRGYRIAGVNMKGKNTVHYNLPREPLATITPSRNSTNWLPFDDSGEIDE